MGDEDEIVRLFQLVGAYDILVTCAGEAVFGAIVDLSMNDIRAMFDSRFFGQIACVKHGVDGLGDRGSIVLISGVADKIATPNYSAGAALDGGINAFARTAAVEFGGRGVRVNVVSPGVTESGITPGENADLAKPFAEWAINSTPLGRAATVEDIADAIQYLVTNEYVNAQIIEVDGGWSAT